LPPSLGSLLPPFARTLLQLVIISRLRMASVQQVENCLICEVLTTEIHLGINTCRACSVFYKRTISQNRILKCKEGNNKCISKDPRTTCRKCRFDRFTFVLTSCSEDKPIGEAHEVVTKEENKTAVRKTAQHGIASTSFPAFLDHETSLLHYFAGSETPTLERMKRAYGVLCLMRKNGEMGTCSTQTFDQLQRGTIKFARETYTTAVPNARIMYTGLMDFYNSSFEDFRKLSRSDQRLLLYGNFDLLNKIDDLYRSVNHFPDDDTLMPNYTTIYSADRVDDFLIDCPQHVNKEEAAVEIIKNVNRNLVTNKAMFKRVQLTGEEFLAVLGLALWNDQTTTDDEKITDVVKKNRTLIMAELHKYYATGGRTDYADRLGEVLCLLVNMEEAATQHQEDEKVYFLMNMYNEYMPELGHCK
ncbi:hypothetical protein PENTCL1PPCAC_14939, partial [Pristionchus entomophagus]